MRIRVTSMVAIWAVCLLARGVAAQDGPLTEFKAVDAEWRELDGEINELIEQYRKATVEERGPLVAEYQILVDRSRKLIPLLRQTAVAAYKADPKVEPRVEETLIGLIANDVRQDEYERALELGGLLVKGGCTEPVIDSFIGIAAYCVDNFDAAEVHLKKAQTADALTQTAEITLKDLPTAKQAWAAEQATRVKEADRNDLPRVQFETSKGTLVIELYENEAPQAVGNFVSLIEAGFYDGLTFHRVLPGFMAQGGCPDGTGAGGPGYEIACECYRPDHRKHFRGTLSMAHAGRDTGGSQFFLTFKRTAHLDGVHTVFGRVIEGLDVLAKLQRRDPSQEGKLPEPDKIVKATVLRKRDHEYKPTKVGG